MRYDDSWARWVQLEIHVRCEGSCCDAVVVVDADVVATLVDVLDVVLVPRCLRPLHH